MKNESSKKNIVFSQKNASFYKARGIFFKGDIIVGIILIIAVVASLFFMFGGEKGEIVDVYFEGELIASYSLRQDGEYKIERKGTNIIIINDGKASMLSSTCKDRLCEHSSPIFKAGQRIVCAPNGIVVVIRGKPDVDGVTGVANEF